jgi:hypothetical protein
VLCIYPGSPSLFPYQRCFSPSLSIGSRYLFHFVIFRLDRSCNECLHKLFASPTMISSRCPRSQNSLNCLSAPSLLVTYAIVTNQGFNSSSPLHRSTRTLSFSFLSVHSLLQSLPDLMIDSGVPRSPSTKLISMPACIQAINSVPILAASRKATYIDLAVQQNSPGLRTQSPIAYNATIAKVPVAYSMVTSHISNAALVTWPSLTPQAFGSPLSRLASSS